MQSNNQANHQKLEQLLLFVSCSIMWIQPYLSSHHQKAIKFTTIILKTTLTQKFQIDQYQLMNVIHVH